MRHGTRSAVAVLGPIAARSRLDRALVAGHLMRAAVIATLGVTVALSGCGRIAFDELADAGGSAVDDSAACLEWTPFSTPVPLPPPFVTGNQWHGWISASGLDLYYYDITTGGNDLYVARRTVTTEAFESLVPLAELNSPVRDANPTLSGDELTIIFESIRSNLTDPELWTATRTASTNAFDAPQLMTALNTADFEQSPSLSPDGLELFFVRAAPAATNVYVSTRADTTQMFTTITAVPEVQAPAGYRDHHVAISPRGDELYLSSNRPGGAGGYDVWVATRERRGMPFSAPILVPEFSSPGDDGVDSLSADGHTAYMFYNANVAANGDMSTAMRSCR